MNIRTAKPLDREPVEALNAEFMRAIMEVWFGMRTFPGTEDFTERP
jgi:hypothetical protein